MKTIIEAIEATNPAARIPALRAVVHSTLAKSIGAIRQHIRDQKRVVRNEEEATLSLDQRNEADEEARSEVEIHELLRFEQRETPIQHATKLMELYDWANSELETLAVSKWDRALTFEQMLEYMINGAKPLDKAFAQALADAARTDVETIKRMHEMEEKREREDLIANAREIKSIFESLQGNGHSNAADELDIVEHHQLGVKIVEALNKARDQVLARVLRTRRISDLGSVPLIEDGIKIMTEWVSEFETIHQRELGEAMDAGRTVRTVEDL